MANGRGRGRAATYVRGKGKGEEGVVWPGFCRCGLGCPSQNCCVPRAMPAATFDATKKIYFLPPPAHTVRGLWNPLGMVFREIIDKMSMLINTQKKSTKEIYEGQVKLSWSH